MMESILDSLTAEKLYPSGGTNLLDLEELSDGDFLTNVVSSLSPALQLTQLYFFVLFCLFVCPHIHEQLALRRRAAACIRSPVNQTHICYLFRPEPDLGRAV